ncbi:MAG: hypothetical protein KAI47_11355 [Deltaproteobacteria bacterium]|nr:hypothetical protein [Deltaproteobacteria bacterium]
MRAYHRRGLHYVGNAGPVDSDQGLRDGLAESLDVSGDNLGPPVRPDIGVGERIVSAITGSIREGVSVFVAGSGLGDAAIDGNGPCAGTPSRQENGYC